MGLLAYDPERLGYLQRSMRSALDELRGAICSDPAAATASAATRAAAAQLDGVWLPLVWRLSTTDPLTRCQQREAHIGALDESLVEVMAHGYGWSVQTDPLLDNAAVVTPEEARALGARLNEVDHDALARDPAQLRWVCQQLTIIGRDPALSREFLANFHDWASLCDRLGAQRALLLGELPTGARVSVADLDGVFAALAHVQRNVLRTGAGPIAPGAVLPEIDEMNPYSAALVVRSLGLDAASLALVADHLLVRWRTMPWQRELGAPVSDYSIFSGPNTGDILFEALLSDPAACTAFVRLAGAHPDILFATADDEALAHAVILLATDPANVAAAEAEGLVLPLIDHFRLQRYTTDALNEGYDATWPVFLVDLISPWTMQLSPLNDDWQATPARKAELLAFALHDPQALSRLVANADTVRDGAIATLATGDSHTLDEFAAYLGLLSQLVVHEHVADADEANAAWQMMIGIAGIATVFLPGGMAVGLVANSGLFALASVPPADPAKVAADADYAEEYTLTAAAAATVDATAAQWLADGTLPRSFPRPPTFDAAGDHPAIDYELAIASWIARLPGGRDGPLADRIVRLKDAFLSSAGAGGALAG